jgi:NDP-sugar pyrophosphorylase family protein
MRKELRDLESKISNFVEDDLVLHKNFGEFIENCTIVLSAGGEGSRFKNMIGDLNVNKCSFVLPNNQTMIERVIEMYKKIGFNNFVVLVYHQADSIINLLGDGSRYNVKITYSHDPEKPVGRGGAIKNALVNKTLNKSNYLIVHNPDDQIVGDTDAILTSIINRHLYNQDKGSIAVAVVVKGSNYEFSGMRVEEDVVTSMEMYPFIPIPCHVGITVFSPEIHKYFDELFDLEKKCDFEAVLFPVLAKEKKLHACNIPLESWISVNNEKGFKKLVVSL